MSVRAYRINKIEYKKEPSFNLWHSEELVKKLEDGGYLDHFNEGGEFEIDTDDLKRIISEVKLDDYEKEQIEDDIKWAEKNQKYYLNYYCF